MFIQYHISCDIACTQDTTKQLQNFLKHNSTFSSYVVSCFSQFGTWTP